MCIQIAVTHSIGSDVVFGCTGRKPEVRRGRLKVEVHDFICQCLLQYYVSMYIQLLPEYPIDKEISICRHSETELTSNALICKHGDAWHRRQDASIMRAYLREALHWN